jgi:hypothetical protein
VLSAEAGTPARIQPAKTTGCRIVAPPEPAGALRSRPPRPSSRHPAAAPTSVADSWALLPTVPLWRGLLPLRAAASSLSRQPHDSHSRAVKTSLCARESDDLAARVSGDSGERSAGAQEEARATREWRAAIGGAQPAAARLDHHASSRRVASSSPSGPSSSRCSSR